jgi:hypothetical protein
MANIYTKSMRDALQEARDYRDTSDIDERKDVEEVKEHLSYDEWLKEEKGIKEGAHGINSDEHAKYSTEWKNYVTEIVGGRGEMTITKDGGVMIIKTKDWQTYKAKGWVKREEVENESLELSATGAITSNSTGQEDESEELNEIWPFGKKVKLPKGYNPKPAIKAYDLFRKAYDELKKSGVIDRSGQEQLQQLYYHLVVNHLGSREANRLKIKTINGPDRRYGDGKIFQDATR